VDKSILQNQKDLNEARAQETQDLEKITQLEAERVKLLAEQAFISQNTTESQRAEAQRVAGLSEAQKIAEETKAKIAEKTAEYEAEKQKRQKMLEINQQFLAMSSLNQQQYNDIVSSARLANMTKEEQDLVLKLAREKLALTQQKDSIIAQQQDIANATKSLSDVTTLAQLANIGRVKSEYDSLLNKIQSAIAKQQELNSMG
jgi:anaerobic ribonucleoside-triphosphate reductase